jgi:hypothetical protein
MKGFQGGYNVNIFQTTPLKIYHPPFVAATDNSKGEIVYFSWKSSSALPHTCIPIVFQPVNFNNTPRIYGVLNNFLQSH